VTDCLLCLTLRMAHCDLVADELSEVHTEPCCSPSCATHRTCRAIGTFATRTQEKAAEDARFGPEQWPPGSQLTVVRDMVKCRLTEIEMNDPVWCQDGCMYERGAIAAHFASIFPRRVSPVTGKEVDHRTGSSSKMLQWIADLRAGVDTESILRSMVACQLAVLRVNFIRKSMGLRAIAQTTAERRQPAAIQLDLVGLEAEPGTDSAERMQQRIETAAVQSDYELNGTPEDQRMFYKHARRCWKYDGFACLLEYIREHNFVFNWHTEQPTLPWDPYEFHHMLTHYEAEAYFERLLGRTTLCVLQEDWDGKRPSVCTVCTKRGQASRCGLCIQKKTDTGNRGPKYCSRACQKADWALHKLVHFNK
jgi:hypothetical protein